MVILFQLKMILNSRLCLLFGIFTLIIILSPPMLQATDDYHKLINCNIHGGACMLRVNQTDITLEVTPQPVKAMKDLLFRVTLSGSAEEPAVAPHINLNMPKMNMGKNRVKLKKVTPGVYEGKGIIVRCPSGHRVWKATVSVPALGKVDFIFDVND